MQCVCPKCLAVFPGDEPLRFCPTCGLLPAVTGPPRLGNRFRLAYPELVAAGCPCGDVLRLMNAKNSDATPDDVQYWAEHLARYVDDGDPVAISGAIQGLIDDSTQG